MKRMSGAQITAMWKRMQSDAGHWRNTWEDLAWYIHPAKVGFVSEREPGERKTEYIFDSTALQALDDLGHYLSTALTPNSSIWAQLRLSDTEANEKVKIREWLEDCGQRMHAAWLASNFYKMAGECYKDIGCFGTMSMECHEKKDINDNYNGLSFENVHMREVGGLTNRYGELDITIRCYEKNAISWYQEFGENAGMNVLATKDKQPDKMFKFLHICYPRDRADVNEKSLYLGDAKGTELPWASVWVELGKSQIVRESGFYEANRTIARWDINTDTIYGHGPGLKALPDVRTLNEAKRLELIWYEKRLDPPMKTRENNIVGDMDVSAGKLTVVRDMEALAELYQGSADLQFTMLKTDELRDSIRGIFFSDLIRDEGLASRTGVSDYEVARRMERAQRILGEATGALRNEFLKWVVERTFSIMFRAGEFLDPPELEGGSMDVKYISPLQTAQQAQGAESTALFVAELAQLSQIDPSVLDRVNFDKMTKKMAEARNVPADILNSDEEMNEIREVRAEAMARQRRMEEAQAAAGVAKDLGSVTGQDNAADMITGG